MAGEGGFYSPLRAGRISAILIAGAMHPPFSPFLPEENEKTGRARSKRVKEVGGNNAGARLNDRRSRNDFPRDFRLSGGLSDDESTSFSFRWRYPGGGIGLMLALSVWPSARQLPQRGSQVGAAVCPHHFQRGQSVCSADPLASPFGRGGTAKP